MNAPARLLRFASSAGMRRPALPPSRPIPRRWASSSVVSLSDADAVDKFRATNSKSVMYFTATWCPPCKMIGPVYDSLSERYADVAFGKVDVDANQESAAEFKISAVPTFVFSRGKDSVDTLSGADKGKLEELVKGL